MSNNAFDQYEQLDRQDATTRTITRNLEEKHYLFNFADEIPHREVVGGFIRSGEVTPILSMPVWENTPDVPDSMRVAMRNNGTESKYHLAPEPIYQGVLADYSTWGVTDLSTIVNWEPGAVKALQIENVFFPDGIPFTYSEIEAHLKTVKVPSANNAVYEGLRKDLIQAVRNAQRADSKWVDYTEECIEKGKTQPGYVGVYNERSERAMYRLHRQRKDMAFTQVSDRQNAIVDALPSMIEGLAKQQGSSLSPEHLMEFAKALGSQITDGVKEAIAAAASAAPQQPQPAARK